jgi:tetrahydromethanopterin S-methyltransferase subunit B
MKTKEIIIEVQCTVVQRIHIRIRNAETIAKAKAEALEMAKANLDDWTTEDPVYKVAGHKHVPLK